MLRGRGKIYKYIKYKEIFDLRESTIEKEQSASRLWVARVWLRAGSEYCERSGWRWWWRRLWWRWRWRGPTCVASSWGGRSKVTTMINNWIVLCGYEMIEKWDIWKMKSLKMETWLHCCKASQRRVQLPRLQQAQSQELSFQNYNFLFIFVNNDKSSPATDA